MNLISSTGHGMKSGAGCLHLVSSGHLWNGIVKMLKSSRDHLFDCGQLLHCARIYYLLPSELCKLPCVLLRWIYYKFQINCNRKSSVTSFQKSQKFFNLAACSLQAVMRTDRQFFPLSQGSTQRAKDLSSIKNGRWIKIASAWSPGERWLATCTTFVRLRRPKQWSWDERPPTTTWTRNGEILSK